MEIYKLRFCLKKKLIYVMNNGIASYFDEKFYLGNQHNSFCMTHLLWDLTFGEKNWGDTFSVRCV